MTTLKEMNETKRKIDSALDAAIADWFVRQCQDPYAHMYLYYKPGHIGFWIGENSPSEGWILADNRRVSTALTKEQVFRDFRDGLNRLPLLSA